MREGQNLIVSNQDKSMTSQTSTNKILVDVVNNLELTQDVLDRHRDSGSVSSRMVTQLSKVCEELRMAVTGLNSAQDEMANQSSSSMVQLDRVIKSVENIIREENLSSKRRLSVITDSGPATKRRHRTMDSDGHDDSMSGGGSSPSSSVHEDMDLEIKQPTVKLHQATLSLKQKAVLKRSLESRVSEESTEELKDEFISPEKN